MKRTNKILSILLVLVFCFAAIAPAASAEGIVEAKTFAISSPYANVNWLADKQYKTALQNHTNASDADITLRQSIQRHIECGYDAVAITDSSTVNTSWAEENFTNIVHKGFDIVANIKSLLEKNPEIVVKALDYLGTSGSFANGMTYTLAANGAGDDILTVDTGNGTKEVLRVPFGDEQNGFNAKAHMTSWFADYNTTVAYADYSTIASNVGTNYGLCVVNHPGEFSKANCELNSASAYNNENVSNWYFNNKIATLLNSYKSCVGLVVNSANDTTTRFDRVLWDEMLKRFSLAGENVFGFATSDAATLAAVDTAYVQAIMPELSSAALKNALANGQFFSVTNSIGNPEELTEIAASLKEFYGEDDLYMNVNSVAAALTRRAQRIANGELGADEILKNVYTTLDKDGNATAAAPAIKAVATDDVAQTITISADNALLVRWISDGKLVATTKVEDGTSTLNLAGVADKLGNYIRAEIFGEGGLVYTQAFLLNAQANAVANVVDIDSRFVDLGAFDFIIPVIAKWVDIFRRIPAALGITKK